MKIVITLVLLGISTLSFAHQYHAHHGERNNRQDTDNMAKVKQLMEKARQESDEQYYMRASKLLDKIKKSSPQKKIFKAEIQQYFHHFDQALETLNGVKDTATTDLLRASIYFTQGKFELAHQHCKKLFGQVDHLLALTCMSHANSLQGELDRAYKVLLAAIEHVQTDSSQSMSWAYVTLAEMSERKADYSVAKNYYQRALEINSMDIPTRIAYADILLQEKDALNTITITREFLYNDLLRLRYVRANNLYTDNKHDKESIRLKQRVQHYTEKNQHLHYDLLAEYYLYINKDAKQALAWAKRHWQQQKTPRDARLLAKVAEQAADTSAKQMLINWQKQNGLEDKQLDILLTGQKISLR